MRKTWTPPDPMNRRDNPYLTEVGRLGLTITLAFYAVTWSFITVLGVLAYVLAVAAGLV